MIESALMPGSNTPNPPGSQIQAWPGCQTLTSSFHSTTTDLIWRLARKARAGSTAGAKRECQVANSVRPVCRAAATSGVKFADGRTRRLFEQHVLAGLQRGRRLRVTHLRRRAERNGIDVWCFREQLIERREMRDALDGGIAARRSRRVQSPRWPAIAGMC